MKRDQSPIQGVIVPLVTPVDQQDDVDAPAFRSLIRRCLASGVDGLFVGGSAGTGPLLSDAAWQRSMEIAHSEASGKCRLMSGIITTSTSRAKERIHVLREIGYDIIVVTPTFYITPSRSEEFFSHFAACRQACDMDMVLYNIPSCTGSSVPLNVIRDVCSRGWIRAFKESSGDRAYFKSVQRIGSDFGVSVLQGNEPDMAWSLARGAAGVVPVCANIEPATFLVACQAARAKDKKKLTQAQQRINLLRDYYVTGDKNWVSGILYGVSRLGIGSGRPPLPLQELNNAEKRRIDSFPAA